MKPKTQAFLAGSLLVFTVHLAAAGSATWDLNPPTNSWTTPGNWTPATVPNGPTDVATVGASNTAEISLAAPTSAPLTLTLDSLVFIPGAEFYTIDVSNGLSSTQLLFVGAGIVNNSNRYQFFNVSGGVGVVFSNSAAMGEFVAFTLSGSTPSNPATSSMTFKDNTSVSDSNEIDVLGSASGAAGNAGALVSFLDHSDAGYCSVIGYGGQVAGAAGATILFDGSANLGVGGAAAFGGAAAGAFGATVTFQGNATLGNGFAGSSAGTAGGGPGYLFFKDNSTGGTGELAAQGVADISQHNPPGLTVGIFAGDGTVYLGSNNLTSGFPNTYSTFTGTIKDGGAGGGTGGSMTFSGGGGVNLQGASTYTGGTIIDDAGSVNLYAPTGSALGTGPVQIFSGVLSGTGSVSNTVVVGTGSGPRALLVPSLIGRATISIRKNVVFKADATYFTYVSQKPLLASKAAARGVRIESGATIDVELAGSRTLRSGNVYTVLENTSPLATVGTFANLPDGGTIVVGNRTLQANYEGGDGNDLTLTVQ